MPSGGGQPSGGGGGRSSRGGGSQGYAPSAHSSQPYSHASPYQQPLSQTQPHATATATATARPQQTNSAQAQQKTAAVRPGPQTPARGQTQQHTMQHQTYEMRDSVAARYILSITIQLKHSFILNFFTHKTIFPPVRPSTHAS